METTQRMALLLMQWHWSTLLLPSILTVDVMRMGFLLMCFFGTCWCIVVVLNWLRMCQHPASTTAHFCCSRNRSFWAEENASDLHCCTHGRVVGAEQICMRRMTLASLQGRFCTEFLCRLYVLFCFNQLRGQKTETASPDNLASEEIMSIHLSTTIYKVQFIDG
jgi:hypothetical protein